ALGLEPWCDHRKINFVVWYDGPRGDGVSHDAVGSSVGIGAAEARGLLQAPGTLRRKNILQRLDADVAVASDGVRRIRRCIVGAIAVGGAVAAAGAAIRAIAPDAAAGAKPLRVLAGSPELRRIEAAVQNRAPDAVRPEGRKDT